MTSSAKIQPGIIESTKQPASVRQSGTSAAPAGWIQKQEEESVPSPDASPEEEGEINLFPPNVYHFPPISGALLPLPELGPPTLSIDWFSMSRPYYDRGVPHLRFGDYDAIQERWLDTFSLARQLGFNPDRASWISNQLTPKAIDSALKGDFPTTFELMNRELNVSPIMLNAPTIYFKLNVGGANDSYEQEADHIAEQVMRMPEQAVQRTCTACKEEELQLKPQLSTISPLVQSKSSGAQETPPWIESQINEARSGGSPLPEDARTLMEGSIGADFSGVKVHTGSHSEQLNRSLNAKAFTVGNDVFFGAGQFNPRSMEGKGLLAHELTHVMQQGMAGERVSCAYYDVNGQRIHIDYDDVVFVDTPADRENQIITRYETWNGSPMTAVMLSSVQALSQPQKRWLHYGLDILIDNPHGNLNKQEAVTLLIAFAPNASFGPKDTNSAATGASRFPFVEEVLRASGWYEVAFTSSLTAPSSARASAYARRFYNTGSGSTSSGSSCPAPRGAALAEPAMRSGLPPLVRSYLGGQAIAVSGANIASGSMSRIRTIADRIQAEALQFFSPYIGRGRTRPFLANWQYSSNLQASTAPGAIDPEVREAFIRNRADLQGSNSGLWTSVNYEPRCAADRTVFNDIIQQLLTEPQVISDLNTILSWQSFTDHGPSQANVTINLQYNTNSRGRCEARWRQIETICHELIHVYVDQRFYNLHSERKIIKEGFTEILGDQLYQHIRSEANNNAAYRRNMEAGLVNACNGVSIPAPTRGYQPASDNASSIRQLEGDDNFRAAYFMGRFDLVGLQPKLESGTLQNTFENEADTVARHVMLMEDEMAVAE